MKQFTYDFTRTNATVEEAIKNLQTLGLTHQERIDGINQLLDIVDDGVYASHEELLELATRMTESKYSLDNLSQPLDNTVLENYIKLEERLTGALIITLDGRWKEVLPSTSVQDSNKWSTGVTKVADKLSVEQLERLTKVVSERYTTTTTNFSENSELDNLLTNQNLSPEQLDLVFVTTIDIVNSSTAPIPDMYDIEDVIAQMRYHVSEITQKHPAHDNLDSDLQSKITNYIADAIVNDLVTGLESLNSNEANLKL